jgi:hypothetical protein
VTESRLERLKQKFPSDVFDLEEGTNIHGLAKTFAQEYELADEEIANLLLEIQVSTATGLYLEDIARLFRLYRESGETDEQLRARILAYWESFSGGGTLDAIKKAVASATGKTADDISIDEYADMKILIGLDVPLVDLVGLPALVEEIAWQAKAAGIYPFFQYTLTDSFEDNTLKISDSIIVTSTQANDFFRTSVTRTSYAILDIEPETNYFMQIGIGRVGTGLVA